MASVTNGYTFTGTTDPITYTKLNLLGQPTVTIGTNEVTLAMMATLAGPNYLLGRYTTAAGNVEAIDLTTQGLGFYAGAGGAVTQGTSRTTTVIVNAMCGAITLVSAAGSTSWQSFTVTNSKVAATDTVIVVQKSGTDKNLIHVTAVGAGSFEITFATASGTTVEQPVFNFAVIKAVAS